MSDNKSFEQLSIEQESGYPITMHDVETGGIPESKEIVGNGSGRRERMDDMEKSEPKLSPTMASLDQGSIDHINSLFKEQKGKLDEQRIIFYPKELIGAGKAHQDIVNGLTLAGVSKENGRDSAYFGISNATFGAGDGMILTFIYKDTGNQETFRMGTDKLIENANAVLKAVEAKILIPVEAKK